MAVSVLCAIAADIIVFAMGLAVLLAVVIAVSQKTGRKAACYLYIIFYVVSYIHSAKQIKPLSEDSYILENSPYAVVTGFVQSITPKEGYSSIVLKNCEIQFDTEQVKVKGLLLSVQACEVCVGDSIQAYGRLKAFEKARNEGEFDSRSYYASVGICYRMSVEMIEIRNQSRESLVYYLSLLRKQICHVYEQISPQQEAGVFSSMVLGDKSSLDREVKALYQRNGIAHLLAISGLHISLIGMVVYKMIRKLGIGFGMSFAAGGLVVISYGLLTGNGISAVRAVVMCLLLMLAELLGRTYDCLSALGTAAVFMLWDNPFVLYNGGFLLSFSAILGIALIYPVLEKMLIKKEFPMALKYVLSSLLISISVNMATFPVILSNYYEFPVYAVLLNIIVVPCMTLLMFSAVTAGIVGMVNTTAGIFLIGLAHYILKFYEFLCKFVNKLPYSVIITGKPGKTVIVLYGILLICFVYGAGQKKIHYHKAMLLLPVIGVLLLISGRKGGFEIDMIDVGQGDGILMMTPEKQVYLFDGGSSDEENLMTNTLLPLLKYKGIQKIDYAVVSHSDEDHISGLLQIITEGTFQIGTLILPEIKSYEEDTNYCALLSEAGIRGIAVEYARAGDEIGTGQVSVRCLHPQSDYDYTSANDYSAVYLITYGQFRMLMTGDAEQKAEQSMLALGQLLDIHILKVGHHGSKSSTSAAFLEAVKPEAAIISCGKNNRYHHPSEEVIQRLKQAGVYTFVTAWHGEIIIKSDGKSYEIRQWNS